MPEPVAWPWRWVSPAEQVNGDSDLLHDRGGDEGDAGRVAHVDFVRREADGRAGRRSWARPGVAWTVVTVLEPLSSPPKAAIDGGDDGAADQGGDERDEE